MKKNTKIKTLSIIAVVFLAVVSTGIIIGINLNKENDIQEIDPDVKIFTENYPTDILILGENFEILDGLYIRNSEIINEDILENIDGCERQIIFISDYNETYNPTVDELKLVADKLNACKCDVYIIGNALDEKLVEAGILPYVQPEGRWTGYVTTAYGTPVYSYGIDTAEWNMDFNDENDRKDILWGLIGIFEINLRNSLE